MSEEKMATDRFMELCAALPPDTYWGDAITPDIVAHIWQAALQESVTAKDLLIASLKEQNALLTVQVQGLRDALEDLLEQFDPRNHQTYCECDPSVGYQCAACKFPSIPAVGAAHDALSALPQSEDVRDAELIAKVASAYGILWHVNAGLDAPKECGVLSLTPERAAMKARHILRDELTREQRGVGINEAHVMLVAESAALSAQD